MKAYVNHFCLNFGSALANLWFAFIPPQWTGHDEIDLEELRKSKALRCLRQGLGIGG